MQFNEVHELVKLHREETPVGSTLFPPKKI